MLKQALTVILSALAALGAAAGPAWRLNEPGSWKQTKTAAALTHDFGALGKVTPEGFAFHIDKRYHKIMMRGAASGDLSTEPVLEVYHRGAGILFALAAYGPGESGYDEPRLLSGEWEGNERFHPQRTAFELTRMPRWRQGGVQSLHLIFSNSGEGATATVAALALRRGVDTLPNGAFLIREQDGTPAFWKFSPGMKAALSDRNGTDLPLCRVSAGVMTAPLDSLIPAHRYDVSVRMSGGGAKARAVIYDRKGAVLTEAELRPCNAGKTPGLHRAEYVVPQDAFRGELILEFPQGGEVADALAEDRGNSGPNWNASWIWRSKNVANGEVCYFRREFEIADLDAVKTAFLQATCDDAFAMEVNNNRIFSGHTWSNPMQAEVRKYLVRGKNVLTAVGRNNTGAAGFLAELTLRRADKTVLDTVKTDSTWSCRSDDPGANWRRIEPPEETKRNWQSAAELARPPEGPWGNKVAYRTSLPPPGNRHTVDRKKFAQVKTAARVNRDLPGMPRLEINGEIVTPMLFGIRPRGDRTESYKTIQKSGFTLFRLGWEFSFEALRPDGSVDYSGLETQVEELLAHVPDAKIILMFRISPPSFWTQKYPEELIRYADGKSTGADGVFASPASTVFREQAARKVAEVVAHIEKSWFSGAVIGYMPCNLRGPEWVVPARHNCYPDYSKPMERYFREYLRETYRTDAALRKAWRDPKVTLDTAALPREETRKPETGYFLPPERQDVFDYNRAANRANVDTIVAMLDAVRAAAPEKLRVLYFGYLMTLDHTSKLPSISGHYDLSRLLAMDKVDVMASPVSYIWRRPGEPSSIGTVESSFAKHGVVWLQEADNRTYLASESEEMRVNFHAAASLRENWREWMLALLKRQAIWFYELGGGWYDHRYFHEDFRRMLALYGQRKSRPVTYRAPLAWIFDEKAFDGVALSDGRWAEMRPFCLAASSQRMAALCGVPYDIYELEDLYTLDLSQYKVLVFPNAWRKNEKLARFLREKVYPAGKTCVWLYAPGYGQGGDLTTMRELTGFTFRKMPSGTALAFRTHDGREVGTAGTTQSEVFAVQTAQKQLLGTYPDGAAAAAWKRQNAGKSVFLSTADPSGGLLREILRNAGVTPLVDRADRAVCDGELLGTIAVDAPGERIVTFPETPTGDVTELISGEKFTPDGNTIRYQAEPGDVKLFQYR